MANYSFKVSLNLKYGCTTFNKISLYLSGDFSGLRMYITVCELINQKLTLRSFAAKEKSCDGAPDYNDTFNK